MVLFQQTFSLGHAVRQLVTRALGLPFADFAQILDSTKKSGQLERERFWLTGEQRAAWLSYLVGFVVEHARGGEDLVPVLQGGVEALPLLLQLGRLELNEVGGVVAAGDQLAGHVVDVLDAGRSALVLAVECNDN